MLLTALTLSFLPLIASREMEAESEADAGALFFITKSENHNEVHYDLRLGKNCEIPEEDPVHAYWRDREISETATSELTILERSGYGVGQVRRLSPHRARIFLRALPSREIEVQTQRTPQGACRARAVTRIGGAEARLSSIHLELSGWSVVRATVRGIRIPDGAAIEEMIDKK
ncbi:MAG: DUF4833 domain-containing protein [Myxococcota bacterium]